jgi:outer membrane immunogenic protein
MHKFCTFGAALALVSTAYVSPANAADLPEPSLNPSNPSWTGFYVGGLFGAGGLVHQIDIPADPAIFSFNGLGAEGIVGGGMVGYNHQIGSNLVLGVQFDGLLSGIESELSLGPIDASIELDYSLAVSGRIGYLINPDALAYIIGGYTWGEFTASVAGLGSVSENVEGFHVGGGLEAKVTEDITARVEYRYTQFTEEEFFGGFVGIEPSMHVGTIGVAWNLWSPGGGSYAQPVADLDPVIASWTGFYLGGQLGGGAIVHQLDVPAAGPVFSLNGIGGEGFLGGVMGGYNWQLNNNLVIGAQVDWTGSDVSTDVSLAPNPITDPISGSASVSLEHMVSISARLGYLINPDAMAYVIGGYTHGWFDATATIEGIIDNPITISTDEDLSAFHVGTGLEANITDNLRARAEYRYVQFEEKEFGGGILGITPSLHMGTVGVAWVF